MKSCFSPDDKLILSGSSDHNAYLWEVDAPTRPPRVLEGHAGEVNQISFCATDMTKFASCSDDGSVSLWRTVRTVESIEKANEDSRDYYSSLSFDSCSFDISSPIPSFPVENKENENLMEEEENEECVMNGTSSSSSSSSLNRTPTLKRMRINPEFESPEATGISLGPPTRTARPLRMRTLLEMWSSPENSPTHASSSSSSSSSAFSTSSSSSSSMNPSSSSSNMMDWSSAAP